MPPLPKPVSRLPLAFRRITAKSSTVELSVTLPEMMIFPSGCSTALKTEVERSSKPVTLTVALPPVAKVASSTPVAPYRASTKLPVPKPPETPATMILPSPCTSTLWAVSPVVPKSVVTLPLPLRLVSRLPSGL